MIDLDNCTAEQLIRHIYQKRHYEKHKYRYRAKKLAYYYQNRERILARMKEQRRKEKEGEK